MSLKLNKDQSHEFRHFCSQKKDDFLSRRNTWDFVHPWLFRTPANAMGFWGFPGFPMTKAKGSFQKDPKLPADFGPRSWFLVPGVDFFKKIRLKSLNVFRSYVFFPPAKIHSTDFCVENTTAPKKKVVRRKRMQHFGRGWCFRQIELGFCWRSNPF